MKKFIYLFTVISVVAIFASCSKDSSTNPNYLQVNSKSYALNEGLIEDNGTDPYDLTYRDFGILFRDNETSPSVVFQFHVYSNTTSSTLQPGTYIYDYIGNSKGTFSYFHYGYGMTWDQTGNMTAGTLFDESSTNIVDGSKITISQSGNSNYVFDIDMQVLVGGSTISVKGKFEDVLTSESYLPTYW
jgi:hypothetical protein